MSNGNPPYPFLLRDGARRQDRFLPALAPSFAQVDERTIADWLRYARQYAKELKYYNEQNQESGDWSAFLHDDDDVEAIARFIKDPSSLDHDPEKKARYSRPHFALFLTFLQLLQEAKAPMNSLTQRHLEFYYRQVLAIAGKPFRPDQVHVFFQLEETADPLLLPKGTELAAGQDQEGNPLVYTTDEGLVLNHTQLDQVKLTFRHEHQLYAAEDARRVTTLTLQEEGENSWKTFGPAETYTEKHLLQQQSGKTPAIRPARRGLALASPILLLTDKERLIELSFSFESLPRGFSIPDLASLEYFLSTEKGMQAIPNASAFFLADFQFSTFKANEYDLDAHPDNQGFVEKESSQKPDFLESDIGDVLVIEYVPYRIVEVTTPHKVKVKSLFDFDAPENKIFMPSAGDPGSVSVIEVDYNPNDTPGPSLRRRHGAPFSEMGETLNFYLNREWQLYEVENKDKDNKAFIKETSADKGRSFKVRLSALEVTVKVFLTIPPAFPSVVALPPDLREKEDFQAPFQPIPTPFPTLQMLFPKEKEAGRFAILDQWAFSSVEVQVKSRLKNLWLQNDDSTIDPGKAFKPFGADPVKGAGFYFTHPELQVKPVERLELAFSGLSGVSDSKKAKASLAQFDFGLKVPLKENFPFSESEFTLVLEKTELDSLHPIAPQIEETFEEAVDWPRFFKLEFEQDSSTPVQLKGFTLRYTAASLLQLKIPTSFSNYLVLYHVHPFGYTQIGPEDKTAPIVPYYPNRGELYLGLSRLQTPQNLSLLFQMSEGSADPETATPPVVWSYLGSRSWVTPGIDDARNTRQKLPLLLLKDGTQGLLNSGVVQLNIPEATTNQNTMIRGNLHWIRMAVAGSAAGISDTIDIHTQAVKATFQNNNNAAEHLDTPLPAESISGTAIFFPGMARAVQPYASFNGRPEEKGALYYTRVSERLRHKQRALTMWDYERLVLEQFPEIYKVKCLDANDTRLLPGNEEAPPGRIEVVVIPDIRGKRSFNPFKPKVPVATLRQIEQFLRPYAPAFADIRVSNPRYEEIVLSFYVKFKPGADEGYYQGELQEALKRHLSPWAFEEEANVELGQSIYAGRITYFIEKQPYVEYVSRLLMIKRPGEKGGALKVEKEAFHPEDPRSVWVTTQQHTIRTVAPGEEVKDGIGYMSMEVTFRVGSES